MKSGSEKSSTAKPTPVTQASNQPFFAKAGGGNFFEGQSATSVPAVQMKMRVNEPGDKFEQEADKMADKIMRMPDPTPAGKEDKVQRQPDDKLRKKEDDKIQKAALPEDNVQKAEQKDDKLQKKEDDKIQKAPAPDDKVQKKEDDKLQKKEEDKLQRKSGDGGAPAVGANTQSAIQNKTTGGQPLSSDVRNYMEPRLGADFSNVRIHNDTEAAGLSNQLSAKAFTYQNHVFFSRDQYQPGTSDGKQLLAHELTHTIQQGHAIQRKAELAAPSIQRNEKPQEIRRAAAPAAPVIMSSEVVDVSANTFAPSEKVKAEIEAQGQKGLDVRVAVKGVTGEGHVKIRVDSSKNYDSIGKGSMPLLNAWTDQMGGMFINFTVKNSAIKGGYASLKPGGGDTNDWVQTLQKNAALLGGLGLKIGHLPTPVNKFDNGTLTLGVTNLKVEIGGYVDALFTITLENVNKPKIDATADIDIKGAVKGQLKLDNTQDKLAGEVSLAVTFKSFSGAAKIKYNPDGTVDVGGKAAYNADQLSGEIEFVSTDLEAANNFAKDAITAAGGKENVQNAGPPAPVPVPKPGKKQRALAATGQLTFHLTQWFAGMVTVVVDGKGDITVIGKIAPPAEIELFKQRDWDKELIKFEAKAYYGIPVVGNLNLFANISLHALAKLGPAKIYNIEILGTYSTDPAIQKSIQISASLNISAYAGLRLRAEGGAGVEILDHDLKFGVGLNADIGVKAYADARPTIGYREPGEFYVSGTLEMVAQPMLGLGGDFFIQLETPWWSPLSDDKWTWPLFSKEWPLSDPIGINASVKDYVLGSGKVPEVELKKPEFDPSKFMTNMVDRTLPEKSGGQAAGQGSFKEDGSVPKPVVPPKKPEPKKAPAPAPKKGTPPKGGKSGAPDPKAAKDQDSTKILKSAATALKSLKGKEPFTRSALDKELNSLKKQVGGVDFDVQSKDTKWSVTPKAGGKKGKAFDLVAKVEKGGAALQAGVPQNPEDRSKQGMQAAVDALNRFAGSEEGEEVLAPLLKAVKTRYQFTTLEIVIDGDIWDVEGSMSPKRTSKTKVKNPISVYKTIVTALGLSKINEKNAKKFREKMRAAIVAKYKGNLTGLNTDVLVSSVIPAAQNRIRGDIFEQWLQDNQVIDKPSPIFVHNNLFKKRISDGVKGSSLVDAKVRQPGSGPSASDIEQMQDYNTIISNNIKSISKNVTFKGPFVRVIYIFNDKTVIPFWRTALVSNLKGNYSTM